MKLKIIQEKDDWNEFVKKNDGSFLQSFEWGDFQKKFQRKVWRFEITNEDNKKILEAQIIKEKSGYFSYFYIPYGPIFDRNAGSKEKKEAFALLLKEIKNIAKEEGAVFLRIEPIFSLPPLPKDCYSAPAARRIQPQKTIILDLKKSAEEILKNMHKTTRYNVRLAIRRGVKIKILDNYSDVFYRLLEKTKKRQSFVSHKEEHYKKLFSIKDSDFKIKMFLAEYEKMIISASIMIFFGKTATSLHSGSDYQYRALKPAELWHWESFLEAKNLGCERYDFWGVDEKKFPGVTSFKRGFGGKEIEYPPGIDIIYNPLAYRTYRILRTIKYLF